MSGCKRCTQLPDPIPSRGYLCVAYPEEAAGMRLRKYLKEIDVGFGEEEGGIISIPLEEGLLDRICSEYISGLSRPERLDTRCLVVEKVEHITVSALLNTKSFENVLSLVEGAWLRELLAEERVVSFFHPILSCTNPREVFGYECLARGKSGDGGIIPAFKLFEQARDGELLFQLDRACRLAAIHGASEHGLAGRIFINFNPTSIYDPEYCLRTTVAAIKESDIDASQVVFEVVESEEVHDTTHLLDILSFYRSNGFEVALDDLGAGYDSLNLLQSLRPDYVKLDMQLIRGVHEDPFKASISRNLLQLAQELGIRSVCEGVETVAEYEWVRENGGDLVQGYYFSKPAPSAWTPPASL